MAEDPRHPRDVFVALLDYWTEFEVAERKRDYMELQQEAEAHAATLRDEWLARYDAATDAAGLVTYVVKRPDCTPPSVLILARSAEEAVQLAHLHCGFASRAVAMRPPGW